VSVNKQLIAEGEKIDQKDNEKLNALAHALQYHDFDAAGRLLSLGARPDTPVTFLDMPVAWLPVVDGDVEAVKALRKLGINYSKLRYRGATAIDFASQSGNKELLDALRSPGAVL